MDRYILERCQNGWILSKGYKVNGQFESLYVIQDEDKESLTRYNFSRKITEFVLGEEDEQNDSSN